MCVRAPWVARDGLTVALGRRHQIAPAREVVALAFESRGVQSIEVGPCVRVRGVNREHVTITSRGLVRSGIRCQREPEVVQPDIVHRIERNNTRPQRHRIGPRLQRRPRADREGCHRGDECRLNESGAPAVACRPVDAGAGDGKRDDDTRQVGVAVGGRLKSAWHQTDGGRQQREIAHPCCRSRRVTAARPPRGKRDNEKGEHGNHDHRRAPVGSEGQHVEWREGDRHQRVFQIHERRRGRGLQTVQPRCGAEPRGACGELRDRRGGRQHGERPRLAHAATHALLVQPGVQHDQHDRETEGHGSGRERCRIQDQRREQIT